MPIEFKDVYFTYAPKAKHKEYALSQINLTLMDTDFVAIIGHTGSGKSTLVQEINALLLPSEGEVIVDEFKITPKSKISGIKKLRKHAGMVFQFPEYQLFEENCLKDIFFGPKNYGEKIENFKEKCSELLKVVGLDDSYMDRSPFELSGGQKRRVAIAGILALDPDILVLDEPTAGLDPQGSKEMLQLFSKLHNELGKMIVLVTHDMDQVLKYCNKAVVLRKGEIVACDEPINIFANTTLLEEIGIEMPQVTKLGKMLKASGLDIDLRKCKDVNSLTDEIARCKGISLLGEDHE